jgi:hypothetical protein
VSAELFDRAAHSRLEDIVSELRAEGWTVQTDQPWHDVPESLNDARFDIVARRGDEILVAEVTTRKSAGQEQLRELARRVSIIPNARLEVFWLGDSSRQAPPPESVLKYVLEARTALGKSTLAALLMAWAALEGAILSYVEQTRRLDGWNSPWQLLTGMYSYGQISEGDYQKLSELWKLRNDVAHHAGSATLEPSLADVNFVADMAELLVAGRYVTADEMLAWFLDRYEDPAESTPYDSVEGGYIYLGNGPYHADEVLTDEFPDATKASIAEATRELERTSVVWVRKDDDEPDDVDKFDGA